MVNLRCLLQLVNLEKVAIRPLIFQKLNLGVSHSQHTLQVLMDYVMDYTHNCSRFDQKDQCSFNLYEIIYVYNETTC